MSPDVAFSETANDDPEVKKEVRVCVSTLSTPKSPLLHSFGRGYALSLIRESFWRNQGSSAVKSVLAKSVIPKRPSVNRK